MFSEEDMELLTKIAKYIFLPIFICYLLGIDVFIFTQEYRKLISLILIAFSFNAICWKRRRLENENIGKQD